MKIFKKLTMESEILGVSVMKRYKIIGVQNIGTAYQGHFERDSSNVDSNSLRLRSTGKFTHSSYLSPNL